MLNNTLNTNEVKDAAGAEIEFQHLEQKDRKRIFAKINEAPALQHRITISHDETGSGINRVRRSMVRVDKQSISTVDLTTPVTSSAYTVSVTPVGALLASDEPKAVLANLMSFLATTGAGTTVLFDCSGSGASALITGSL